MSLKAASPPGSSGGSLESPAVCINDKDCFMYPKNSNSVRLLTVVALAGTLVWQAVFSPKQVRAGGGNGTIPCWVDSHKCSFEQGPNNCQILFEGATGVVAPTTQPGYGWKMAMQSCAYDDNAQMCGVAMLTLGCCTNGNEVCNPGS